MAGLVPAILSECREIGKDRKDEGFAVEIITFDVARIAIDPFPGLRDARELFGLSLAASETLIPVPEAA